MQGVDFPTHTEPLQKDDIFRLKPALCVDLDGTLIATDTFLESILILLRECPWVLFCLPFWAFYGKAYLKHQVAKRVNLDVAHLPYRTGLLAYLREQFRSGRQIVLATGADRQIAEAVSKHLTIFSQIIASDGRTNLCGDQKRRVLEERFGWRGFDYMGNDFVDLKVWSAANAAILVQPPKNLFLRVKQCTSVDQIFCETPKKFPVILKAIRVQQWLKNLLLFLPLVTAHLLFHTNSFLMAFFAFMAFSLCASGLYIFNDLLDLPADRRHPKKQFRPFASGALSIKAGLILHPTLILLAFLLSWVTLPVNFMLILAIYGLTTVSYSLYLKKLAILDVLTLAGLYTLRVLAGGEALGISISTWLLAFSLFFFLSLAFGKRHGELQFRKVSTYQGIERRAYIGADKEMLGIMGVSSGFLSVLVLALYINSQAVLSLYENPEVLWILCPLLLYWISRTWLLAHRGPLDDDPLVVAFRDPRSYLIAATMGLCGFLAL